MHIYLLSFKILFFCNIILAPTFLHCCSKYFWNSFCDSVLIVLLFFVCQSHHLQIVLPSVTFSAMGTEKIGSYKIRRVGWMFQCGNTVLQIITYCSKVERMKDEHFFLILSWKCLRISTYSSLLTVCPSVMICTYFQLTLPIKNTLTPSHFPCFCPSEMLPSLEMFLFSIQRAKIFLKSQKKRHVSSQVTIILKKSVFVLVYKCKTLSTVNHGN